MEATATNIDKTARTAYEMAEAQRDSFEAVAENLAAAQRRTHGGFLCRPTPFSAQEAEGRPDSHAVAEVRRHGQNAHGSGRPAFQEPNFVHTLHHLYRGCLEGEPRPGQGLAHSRPDEGRRDPAEPRSPWFSSPSARVRERAQLVEQPPVAACEPQIGPKIPEPEPP